MSIILQSVNDMPTTMVNMVHELQGLRLPLLMSVADVMMLSTGNERSKREEKCVAILEQVDTSRNPISKFIDEFRRPDLTLGRCEFAKQFPET